MNGRLARRGSHYASRRSLAGLWIPVLTGRLAGSPGSERWHVPPLFFLGLAWFVRSGTSMRLWNRTCMLFHRNGSTTRNLRRQRAHQAGTGRPNRVFHGLDEPSLAQCEKADRLNGSEQSRRGRSPPRGLIEGLAASVGRVEDWRGVPKVWPSLLLPVSSGSASLAKP